MLSWGVRGERKWEGPGVNLRAGRPGCGAQALSHPPGDGVLVPRPRCLARASGLSVCSELGSWGAAKAQPGAPLTSAAEAVENICWACSLGRGGGRGRKPPQAGRAPPFSGVGREPWQAGSPLSTGPAGRFGARNREGEATEGQWSSHPVLSWDRGDLLGYMSDGHTAPSTGHRGLPPSPEQVEGRGTAPAAGAPVPDLS